MPSIKLYVEFLMNIRQATIYATLEDDRGSASEVFIASDAKTLTVRYEDQSATITFPSDISGTAKIEFLVEKRKVISLRLEIQEEDDKPPHGLDMDVANDSPWPASSLSTRTSLACGHCFRTLVEPTPRVWKDLPRENWAELMDLWHCHKPYSDHFSGSNVVDKGYSAQNRPRLRNGLAFVDTGHIYLPPEEVSSIQVLDGLLYCNECDTLLGTVDEEISGFKFYKWSIVLQRTPESPWEKNALQNFICAQLINHIESQATRKFVALSGPTAQSSEGLLLWVFNPDLKYSASFMGNGQPRRAMKIMYKTLENAQEMLDKDSSLEELQLPCPVFSILKHDIIKSNETLPQDAQKLQDWHIALLDRFDPASDDKCIVTEAQREVSVGNRSPKSNNIKFTMLPSRQRQNSETAAESTGRGRLISSNLKITQPTP